MKLAVLSFRAEPDEILDAFHTPPTWLRLLHYPTRSGAFQEGISALWIYGLGCHKDNALVCVGRLGETRDRKVFNTLDSLSCQKKIKHE